MARAYSYDEMLDTLVDTGISSGEAELLIHVAEQNDNYDPIYKRMGVRPRDD